MLTFQHLFHGDGVFEINFTPALRSKRAIRENTDSKTIMNRFGPYFKKLKL